MAFGGVDQFADVSRPVVAEQLRQLGRAGRQRISAVALRGLGGEVIEQQRDILASVSQRRDVQFGDVQAV